MNRFRVGFVTTLMLATALAGGCTFQLTYQGLQGGSPLRGLPPKTFVVDAFTGDFRMFPADKPAKDMVRDAIRQELERNGHTCVTGAAATRADFTISGAVYEWSGSAVPKGLSVPYQADVGMKILATHRTPGGPEFSKKYEGSYRNVGFAGSAPLVIQAFEAAFTQMMRDFTTDPEFLTFLAGQ